MTPAPLGAHTPRAPGGGGAAAAAPPPPPPPPTPAGGAAASPPGSGVEKRVEGLEAEVSELRGAVERLRADLEAERGRSSAETSLLRAEVAAGKEAVDAAKVLLDGAGVTLPGDGAPEKKTDMDAFAKEVSKAMKKGIGQEFRRIAELVTAPTPEALELRRRQIRMFANAMGTNAGLDQAQVATFEAILNETDERAREDLRPLLQGVEDYSKVDYPKVKKLTTDAFGAQDSRIEQEFPKDKADSLKTQLEPVRNLFGAMLDELEKQGTAAK